MSKIYVGNLPFSATEDTVRELFGQLGTVESVALPTDRDTGQKRGFGFVEMSRQDAARAIQSLNGQEMDGRTLKVNEAQDKPRTGGGAQRRYCRDRRPPPPLPRGERPLRPRVWGGGGSSVVWEACAWTPSLCCGG